MRKNRTIFNQKLRSAKGLKAAFFVIFCFAILVVNGEARAKSVEPDFAAEQYSAVKEIKMAPGERQKIKIGFYNRGRYNWRSQGQNFVSIYTYEPKYRSSVFHDASWLKKNQLAKIKEALIGPGQLGYFEFYLTAPKKPGVYTEHFALAAENKSWIQGGQFELIIQVEEGATGAIPSVSLEKKSAPIKPSQIEEGKEPRLRLGLFSTEKEIVFTSPYLYEIKDAAGQSLGFLAANESARVEFQEENGSYLLSWPEGAATSSEAIRFEPTAEISYFVLANHENYLRWNKKINNNKFRDTLEIRYNQNTGYLWVINELSLEYYLKGLAETADQNRPLEFLKALATAARAYTYYNLQSGTRHTQEDFDLDSRIDQVYCGYAWEEQAPWWSDAVSATVGQLVTYQGKVVSTPYFACSNGRTRSSRQVWGGSEKPWLVPVSAPYDSGFARLGHGVGMSLHDALARAKKGASFEEILKYYYQGTKLEKKY